MELKMPEQCQLPRGKTTGCQPLDYYEGELKFIAISDFQGAPMEEVLAKIPEGDFERYVQTGDLAISKTLENLLKKAKSLTNEEIAELKKDTVFSQFLQQRKRVDIAYVNWRQANDSELAKKMLEEARAEHIKLISEINRRFGDRFIHIWGNYDQKDPEHQTMVREVIEDYNLISYESPHYEEIGDETAIIYWPFQPIKKPEDKERLEKWSEELKAKIRGKKRVVVFGHEHIFRGPSEEVYAKRLEEAGFEKPTRTSRNQPNPSARYILNIFKGLRPEAQGVYVFGHLHVPEEEITTGITYLQEKEGKIPFRVFSSQSEMPEEYREVGWQGRKMIDLVYIPQGKVAQLNLTEKAIAIRKY